MAGFRIVPILLAAAATLGAGCEKKPAPRPVTVPAASDAAPAAQADAAPATAADTAPTTEADAAPASPPARIPPNRVLLLTQSRFDESNRPLPATLMIVRPTAGGGWTTEEVVDPDSNVFHKALVFDPTGGGPAILTIGAMGAYLKAWRPGPAGWTAQALYHQTFGGKFDRLRDLEVADVNGDGGPELAIATHDQGVVTVLTRSGDAWQPTELDRRPGIFVHEVETGDIDGDGKVEFFTTPSQPNVSGAAAQGGAIDMYRWNGTTYERRAVMESSGAHAKEILAADLDGDGRSALFAVLEARTEAAGDCTQDPAMVPLRLVRYAFENDNFTETDPLELPDCMCRFLTWGDVDGDRTAELIASTKNAGVFLLRRGETGAGSFEMIDSESSGFEHASLTADLDGNGVAEIYVAADREGELRRYVWNPQARSFDRETLLPLAPRSITWSVTSGDL